MLSQKSCFFIFFVFFLLPQIVFSQKSKNGELYVLLGQGKCSACDFFHWLEEYALQKNLDIHYVLPEFKEDSHDILIEELLYLNFKDKALEIKGKLITDTELYERFGGGVKTAILILDQKGEQVFKGDFQEFDFQHLVKPSVSFDTIAAHNKSLPSFIFNIAIFIDKNNFLIHNRRNAELFAYLNNAEKGERILPGAAALEKVIKKTGLNESEIKRTTFEASDVKYNPLFERIAVVGTYTFEKTDKELVFQNVLWEISNKDFNSQDIYLLPSDIDKSGFKVWTSQILPYGNTFCSLKDGEYNFRVYHPELLRFKDKPSLDKAPLFANFHKNNESNELMFNEFSEVSLPTFKMENKEGYFNLISNMVVHDAVLSKVFFTEKPLVYDMISKTELNFEEFFKKSISGPYKLSFTHYNHEKQLYYFIVTFEKELTNELYVLTIGTDNSPALLFNQEIPHTNPTFSIDENDENSIIICSVNTKKDLLLVRLKLNVF